MNLEWGSPSYLKDGESFGQKSKMDADTDVTLAEIRLFPKP